ncbi:MAG TPA: DoxX family protein, partial [Tenuifilaceae bacterium]|nr:DoxX family protein [Tenuifilaceae bacterium]
GYKFYWATASSGEAMEKIKVNSRVELPFVLGDEVTLKTITRSNPGLILIYNGTIIGKWGWRDIPEQLFKNPDLLAWQLNNQRLIAGNRLTATLVLMLMLAFIALKPWK